METEQVATKCMVQVGRKILKKQFKVDVKLHIGTNIIFDHKGSQDLLLSEP